MRPQKRSGMFTETEEEIWKAWRPMMVFPPDRETSTYLQLRDQAGKLTTRACDLAFLLSMSNGYASLRLLENLRRDSRSRKRLSKSEKISSYLAATRDESTRLAESLALVLERRQAEVWRLKLADGDVASRFAASTGFAEILRRYCEVVHQAQRENRADELRTWRRAHLVQLVDHVRSRGVKHFWQPLAALVSCCQPRGVAIDYIDEAPYFKLSQDPHPLQRSPNQLRQEYLNIPASKRSSLPRFG